jgi:hypothetical protein
MGRKYPDFAMIDRLAREICAAQDRIVDLDVLRNVITLAFLKSETPERLDGTGTVCVIGDGFGTMGALLLASGSASQVVLVNLTRTLLVDLWYLRLWLGAGEFERSVVLLTEPEEIPEALYEGAGRPRARVMAIQAMDHELIQEIPIGLALNMVSMGEMDPSVTAAYFEDLRAAAGKSPRGLTFYCCNRQEKRLPDGTITRFAEYPWIPEEPTLLDGVCPWHQSYYSFRPPFYHPYDGPIQHRIVNLSKKSSR